ncbi:MAG: peroxiredoxin [Thermodesulfobacteriota bacterium]
MPEVLGILVCTDNHLDHLVGLTLAARARGRRVLVFLTGRGVLLTARPEFARLAGAAEMSLCKASLTKYGLDPARPIPGLPPENYLNQARHAELIERADRYLVL